MSSESGAKASANTITEEYRDIETQDLPQTTALIEGLAYIRSARIFLQLLAIPNLDESSIDDFTQKAKKDLENYELEDKKFTQINPLSPEEMTLYNSMKAEGDLLKKQFNQALGFALKSHGKEGPSMDSLRKILSTEMVVTGKDFRLAMTKMLDNLKSRTTKSGEEALAAKNNSLKLIITTFIISSIISIVLFIIILRKCFGPRFTRHLV